MLLDVQTRIERACQKAGRNPLEIKLIAVTKGHSLEEINTAVLRYGHTILGENRIQEAIPKLEAHPNLEWHLIGHLQTNKVKFCAGFNMIHSVDSLRLLEEIAKRSSDWQRIPELLLEINMGFEIQKHGVNPSQAPELLVAARDLGLTVRGLMTVAPRDPSQAKAAFAGLRVLRDILGLEHLSMGMSDDLELAVAEGTTILRIGRACFV
jgi:PLP dependent protein